MGSSTSLREFASSNVHVRKSIEVIQEALERYGLERTCVSFNGGKDCSAVLHLVHSIASDHRQNNNTEKLSVFYASLPDHFEEEEKFVYQMVERYNLRLLQYSNRTLKQSLQQLKNDFSQIDAIFIGTRNDDFHSGTKMDNFAPTDKDWPEFMRINPILEWSYQQVWTFIRQLGVPYCDLYNQGFSSLGTKSDTTRNTNLMRHDAQGNQYFLPAWSLVKPQEERMSRTSSLNATNKETD